MEDWHAEFRLGLWTSSGMSSVTELKDALKSSLDRNGSLRELQAQLRAAIFNSLSDADPVLSSKPGPSDENLVCNELIREYLAWNGYRETLSVFLPGEAEHLGIAAVEGANNSRQVGSGCMPCCWGCQPCSTQT
ncbi:lisH domain-containing protein [Haematococcus lacustris]|uniref:LisH domain-containing protein n=1 Tax=Haematococcus lacustris TaxID=44745 RepID=A0A6A0A8U3_HAELA|nr:lisH domain-containing protein [Haematococcus lacustris]